MILIFVSFESKKDVEKIANYLIDERLAACVTVFPVHSFYFWKDKKLTPKEYEAIVKTTDDKFDKIEKAIKQLLPYEIPQLISIKASKLNRKYLEWLEKQTRF